MNQAVAHVIQLAGLRLEDATPAIIELAEREQRAWRYADSAARELRKILKGPAT